jgi:hypothetical protein
VRHERRNVSGQVYALTVLAPILDDEHQALAAYLAALPGGAASPLARVPGTHFARWVVIDDVIFEGDGQRRRDHLSSPRLLFTTNFDGRLDAYLEGIRTGLGDHADAIWGRCRGYPGQADATAFARWLLAHQIDTSLFFSAYGERTVGEVHASLELRSRLISFAIHAQGLEPETLRAEFVERFPR